MNYGIKVARIVLLGCCFAVAKLSLADSVLQREHVSDKSGRVEVVFIQNDAPGLEFQIFPPIQELAGTVLPMETLFIVDKKQSGVRLDTKYPLIIRCSKGSYQSVFIQDGKSVSGTAPEGYAGPFCLSMWLPYPNVIDSLIHIPYVVKDGQVGKVGVKIGAKGDYRLVEVSDIQLIH